MYLHVNPRENNGFWPLSLPPCLHSPPLYLSDHIMLYLQMPNPQNQEGDRGSECTTAGGQVLRQHTGDSPPAQRAHRDPRLWVLPGSTSRVASKYCKRWPLWLRTRRLSAYKQDVLIAPLRPPVWLLYDLLSCLTLFPSTLPSFPFISPTSPLPCSVLPSTLLSFFKTDVALGIIYVIQTK